MFRIVQILSFLTPSPWRVTSVGIITNSRLSIIFRLGAILSCFYIPLWRLGVMDGLSHRIVSSPIRSIFELYFAVFNPLLVIIYTWVFGRMRESLKNLIVALESVTPLRQILGDQSPCFIWRVFGVTYASILICSLAFSYFITNSWQNGWEDALSSILYLIIHVQVFGTPSFTLITLLYNVIGKVIHNEILRCTESMDMIKEDRIRRLADSIEQFNGTFQLSALLQMAFAFVFITMCLYMNVRNMLSFSEESLFFPSILYFVGFITFSIFVFESCHTGNQIEKSLERAKEATENYIRINIEVMSAEDRTKCEYLIVRLSQKDLITCYGYFPLNHETLLSIGGGILTYLIVFVNFFLAK
ncbi:uncharacterized protein LOC131891064 [Tigriopus californicus]|uniref:uncharacterized protein LOC131891064 n=1 Tax=Tigriopus californicus TaxID=6832 RepID=UPI0027D9E246|nr:uncharacterized protein LOC131891064 [Tigriopus californicus]